MPSQVACASDSRRPKVAADEEFRNFESRARVKTLNKFEINRKFEKFRKGKACVNDEVYIYIALRLQIYSTKFNPIVCTVISRNELQW